MEKSLLSRSEENNTGLGVPDTVALFEQFLADERVTGNPSAVEEAVRLDAGGEF